MSTEIDAVVEILERTQREANRELCELVDRLRMERDRHEKTAERLLRALAELVSIINSAGLNNLANGVQLGTVSWFVKASDRMESAQAVIDEIQRARDPIAELAS